MKSAFVYAGAVLLVAVATVLVLDSSMSKATPDTPTSGILSATVSQAQEASTTDIVDIEATSSPFFDASVAVEDFHYIDIINGCGPYYNLTPCVNVRSGPGVEFPIMERLRTGVVLQVEATTTEAKDGHLWYKVIFDKEIRYPGRVKGDWYIAADPDSIEPFDDIGNERMADGVTASTTKRIVVNLTEEMLYAYDGNTLFMKEPISPGLDLTPTPRGVFTVYYKTPSRYMQGPIPGISDQEYDLPGVPWNLYFSAEGAVIHGAYWHDHFGKRWSHGCVNLFSPSAKKLYQWADLGTPVVVKD